MSNTRVDKFNERNEIKMTYYDFARIDEVFMHDAYLMLINILLAMRIVNIKT
jgi:hypothetical protein